MSYPPTKEPSISAPENGQRPQVLSAAYLRILAVQLAFGFSYSAFLLLPKFLRVELGATATEIGWVSGIALVAAAALSPFVGLSAAYISRRALIAASLLMGGVSGIAFIFASEVGLFVYVLRVMQGLAWVLVFNCTATLTADLVPRERLSQAIGFLGVAMLTTNALAPAVVEPAAEAFGWEIAFGVPSLLSLLSLLVVTRLPREPSKNQVRKVTAPLSRRLIPVFYAALLMGAGIGVMFTFTQPYALSLGADRVGDFFFGYVATALFVRVGLSRLSDRVGPAKVATLALIPYALVVWGTAHLTPPLLPILGAGLGASHGFMYPALMATGLGDLQTTQRPVFVGWLTFSFNSGFAASVLGLGAVADSWGYPVVFTVTGCAIASGVLPLAISQGVFVRRPAIPTA